MEKNAFQMDVSVGFLLGALISSIYFFEIFERSFGTFLYAVSISASFIPKKSFKGAPIFSSSIVGTVCIGKLMFQIQNNLGTLENFMLYTSMVIGFIMLGIIISNILPFVQSILERLILLAKSPIIKGIENNREVVV